MGLENPEDDNIDISLSEKIAQGVYSNMVLINHSTTEFILDFIQLMPGVPKAEVRSRVILTPEHAKRLLFALGANVNKYEENNGEILLSRESDNNEMDIPINFGPPGEA